MTPQEIVDKIDSNNSEISYDVYYTINELLDSDKENDVLLYLQEIFKCTEEIAIETLVLYKETVYPYHQKIVEESRASVTPEQIAHANAVAREWQNKPKCPTCSSTNVKKISAISKVAGASMFGLFSKTARSQFQCNNCGYKW